MSSYKILDKKVFSSGSFSLVPLRYEDRWDIMNWRNEQIYHLRQSKPLSPEAQEHYFANTISQLYDQETPNQILFSFLEKGICIGYGGLVHINWIDKNAEVSFLMNTELEKHRFQELWGSFLDLLEQMAFGSIKLHKIYTYAFDLRPHLYPVLTENNFKEEARLKEHCLFNEKYLDVVIHSKINSQIQLRTATISDADTTFEWATNSIVRMFSLNKNPIEYASHINWFTEKVSSTTCAYLIAEKNNLPVGSIRFDWLDSKKAQISYLVDPKFHGLGLGKVLLLDGIRFLLNLKNDFTLVGTVFKENIPSMKSFTNLGFEITHDNGSSVIFEKQFKR